MRCTLVRYTSMRCTLMGYTPVYAYEMHAGDTYDVHACEICAHEMTPITYTLIP